MGRGKLVALLLVMLALVGAMWGTIFVLGWSPQLGLDLQGGVSIILAPAEGQEVDAGVLEKTVDKIRERVDALGVGEPDISLQGETVQVQLPGVTDRAQAEQVIGRTAQLQMRPVIADVAPDSPEFKDSPACDDLPEAVPPADEEIVLCVRTREPVTPENPEPASLPESEWGKVRVGPVELAGTDIKSAIATVDPNGIQWQVDLGLTKEGGEKFADITGELACKPTTDPQRRFAIVLDGIVESDPGVAEDVQCDVGITGGKAVITTGGGEEDAKELSLVLRTGALPIQMEIQESRSVSPSLGRSSLNAGLLAGAIGLALVALYLLFLYKGIGLAAIAELLMFGVITFGLIVIMGNTIGFALTLAGIAGVIVSIGIAADSSIIYRERFRDELQAGRTIRTAADKAFSASLRTNLTGNFVSFLAAVILYLLAVGPVRGFAFTLGLSTLVDTVLLVTFTRALFQLIARTPSLASSRFMGLRSGVTTPETGPAGAGGRR